MARDAVTCPSCDALIPIISVHVPTADGGTKPATGTVLKRCPRCAKWAWMNPQPLETA
jgi:hypothetical protein